MDGRDKTPPHPRIPSCSDDGGSRIHLTETLVANAGNTLTLESRSSGFFTFLFPFVLNVDENGANPTGIKN